MRHIKERERIGKPKGDINFLLGCHFNVHTVRFQSSSNLGMVRVARYYDHDFPISECGLDGDDKAIDESGISSMKLDLVPSSSIRTNPIEAGHRFLVRQTSAHKPPAFKKS